MENALDQKEGGTRQNPYGMQTEDLSPTLYVSLHVCAQTDAGSSEVDAVAAGRGVCDAEHTGVEAVHRCRAGDRALLAGILACHVHRASTLHRPPRSKAKQRRPETRQRSRKTPGPTPRAPSSTPVGTSSLAARGARRTPAGTTTPCWSALARTAGLAPGASCRCGAGDIVSDHFSRISQHHSAPRAPCDVLYVAPMLLGC